MRLRRLELIIIALTLAFAVFMGGYFTGRRGAVNIVTVSSQNGDSLAVNLGSPSGSGGGGALPDTGAADTGASAMGADVSAGSPVGEGMVSGGADAGSAASGSGDTAAVPSPVASAAQAVIDGRININVASRSQLMDLPGIGSVLAERIVDYRQQNGPFSRIEDLRNVSGIGEKRFEAIEDKVTVG